MATYTPTSNATLSFGSAYQARATGYAEAAPTILLTEDDDDLREVIRYFLGTLHFHVVACSNAESALAVFRQESPVDMLITDLQMPGRSGMELARELTALRPSLPVLIMSGSLLPDVLLEEIRIRSWVFRSKPCRLDALADLIESMLQQKLTLTA